MGDGVPRSGDGVWGGAVIASILYELCWLIYVVLSQTTVLWVPMLLLGALIGSLLPRRRDR